jgi:hypothetical protein
MSKKVRDFTSFISLYETQYEDAASIVIGDSQTPIIATKSKIATLLGDEGSEKTLWKSGMGVKWLKDAVSKFPMNSRVKNVIIGIGTNGGFNQSDDIPGLMKEIRGAFPSARFFAIQGSWGWEIIKESVQRR